MRSEPTAALPWTFWVNPWAWRTRILGLTPRQRIIFLSRVCDIAVRAGTTTIGLWVLVLGLGILTGGTERLAGPSFVHIVQTMPYWGWSILPIIGGAMLTAGSVYRGLVVPAAALTALWAAAWAACLIAALVGSPDAAVTGPVTYCALTLLLLGIAIVHGLIGLSAKGARRADLATLVARLDVTA